MIHYILIDEQVRNALLPLSYTRHTATLRIGIDTIEQKWQAALGTACYLHTEAYLQPLYSQAPLGDSIYINANIIPNSELATAITTLKLGTRLVYHNNTIAYYATHQDAAMDTLQAIEFVSPLIIINNLWDIFTYNAAVMQQDYDRITNGRTSEALSNTNILIGNRIFAEPGAKAEASVLNSTSGPIYLAAESEIMEGCLVRGGFALGEHSQLKMGAKVYGATTLGPNCKVGGEVNNSVFQANSSKAHDGFVGNSVIGEWCNLGADSNNSNLKNNYEVVKLWSEAQGKFIHTGLQFCGLIMADHSKCGINTMFNTGTVVGVSANIFGAGFPRNFIPSYSWGGAGGFTQYALSKAVHTMQLVMARRQQQLSPQLQQVYEHIFNITATQRATYS
jgi:UDP-N-acetylglucosamine diphosphorylase/glucosamine-1-phosphate N-acetyltransferase